MKKWISSLVLMSLPFHFLFAASYDGQETNGGNVYTMEFFRIFDWLRNPEAEQCWADLGWKPMTKYHLDKYRTEVEVRSEWTLELDGKSVAAINQPYRQPPLIAISETKWILFSETQKIALVLHELLPILGFNDRDYSKSSKFLSCYEEWKKSRVHYQQAFRTCDEPSLEVMTVVDFNKMDLSFKTRLFDETVAVKCAAGLQAIIKHDWSFKCDSYCQDLICRKADETAIRPDSESTYRKLDFLETALRGGIELNNCEWKMCKDPNTALHLSKYQKVQNVCSQKK